MKILFTGGGSGGHFYPLIAVAEEVRRIAGEERLIAPELFFMAPSPYDEHLLFETGIRFIGVPTGKLRRYFSVQNALDLAKTAFGILRACSIVFRIFPDVVVGKGGYGSFPALVAARLFGIPVLIHESDSVPGRVNRFAGKFAKRIALSWAEAASSFPAERVAHTGNPLRRTVIQGAPLPSRFAGDSGKGIIFVLGGSLGSVALNEAILKTLPELLSAHSVIHQTGRENLSDVSARSGVLLEHHPFRKRYHPVGYLEQSELAGVGQNASLIVSRAGSAIFEIAAWGRPAILVPITDSNGDHQRENAYHYALAGAAQVIEEENLTPAILRNEIENIMNNESRRSRMSEAARGFAKTDAASVIAREIISMALKHES
ncbi:MAG: UDP-N-acetylglucosamine--N-acetylmuramyl-(pentapeptide) pyrophosphoryl-undecaprenol N-acetylglucosamine transferase, partial [Patescibacteria group bacterium]